MLKANKDDLDRLMEFHEQEAGAYPGRKRYVEVLNKSAVVLVCAAWEAYCEDIVEEAIEHLVDDCDDCNKLPNILKTTVAKRVREDAHDHAPWNLAGNGWKTEIKTSASGVVDKLTGRWNTPKTAPVVELFEKALGIPDIASSWEWHKNYKSDTTTKLDSFVTLRGEIAHRQNTKDSVKKKDAIDFYDHIYRLAEIIDKKVSKMLLDATGKKYW